LTDDPTIKNSSAISEAAQSAASAMPVEYTLDDFAFQVYIEVELIQNEHEEGTKLYTGVKYSYELEDTLQFPLKIKDLSIMSRLGIQIYSMEADDIDKPIASTVVDLFDAHKRLRQGTWNL